jgi:uncharacterized glyoxalase superfamily protein PhnB
MSTTLTPNLMTENVNQSVAFYCERLGFHFLAGMLASGSETPVNEFSTDVPLQWAMLQREGAMLMLQLRASLAGEYAPLADAAVGASVSFYLEVDDLDALLDGLGEGVTTLLPDHKTFYGMREVWISDNNGYIVTLAEKVP